MQSSVDVEEGAQLLCADVEFEPGIGEDVATRGGTRDFVPRVVGPHLECHYPALVAVAGPGADDVLRVEVVAASAAQVVVPALQQEQMAAEAAPEAGLRPEVGLLRLRRIVIGPRMVAEEQPVERDVEVEALHILEVVAETHLQGELAVVDLRTGNRLLHPRAHILMPRSEVDSVAVQQAVLVADVLLEQVASQILAGSHARAVFHPERVILHIEAVPDVGIAPLVVDVAQRIARIGILRGGVEVQHRIERIARTDLQIEGQRTVELPVGDRRRANRPRIESRLERQRRNRIVDFGAHLHRIGHVGFDGQLRGLLHLRDIGLGHLDLLLHLRHRRAGECRQQGDGQQQSLHLALAQFSFSIRFFASSTMPSSAGEYPSATLW